MFNFLKSKTRKDVDKIFERTTLIEKKDREAKKNLNRIIENIEQKQDNQYTISELSSTLTEMSNKLYIDFEIKEKNKIQNYNIHSKNKNYKIQMILNMENRNKEIQITYKFKKDAISFNVKKSKNKLYSNENTNITINMENRLFPNRKELNKINESLNQRDKQLSKDIELFIQDANTELTTNQGFQLINLFAKVDIVQEEFIKNYESQFPLQNK